MTYSVKNKINMVEKQEKTCLISLLTKKNAAVKIRSVRLKKSSNRCESGDFVIKKINMKNIGVKLLRCLCFLLLACFLKKRLNFLKLFLKKHLFFSEFLCKIIEYNVVIYFYRIKNFFGGQP